MISFRYKFLLTFILLEACFVLVIVALNFTTINKTSESLMEQQLNSSGLLLSEVIKQPLLNHDLASIDDALNHFVLLPNVMRVVVFNDKQQIMSEAGQAKFKLPDLNKNGACYHLNKMLMTPTYQGPLNLADADCILFNEPILVDNQAIGQLRFLYDNQVVLEQIAYNQTVTSWIVVLELFIGTLLALFFGQKIANSLNRLTDYADQISQNKTVNFELQHFDRDEIATLAIAMDQMQLKMQQEIQALQEAKQEADSASAAKSDFLAVMSHEIRTPLNGVIGTLNLVDKEQLSPDNAEYVRMIYASSEQLLAIINDILDYSKIQAGKFELDPQILDLKELAAELSAVYKPLIESKGIHFNVEVNLPEPYAELDGVRIKQILTNYLNNAYKFTESGYINLKLFQDYDALMIEVKDSGIGIRSEHIDALFQNFNQLHQGTKGQFGGTGLGLVICKRLAEMMGGRVYVFSDFGKGSIFGAVVLPEWKTKAEFDQAQEARNQQIQGSVVHQYQGQVLLVEDNQVNQMVASKLLAKTGLDVVIANNGVEALECIQEQAFSLIFMDCQMPVMDGFEASRKLRQQGVDTPIIALTANFQPADREACIAAGMNDFLSKPFRPDSLFQMVNKYL